MSEIRVTTLKDTSGANSSTTEQIASGRAKAFLNFNGTGVVAIRASFNVNTITDNGTGDYSVSFTNALADANYVISNGNGFSSVAPAQPASWSIIVPLGSGSSPFAQSPTSGGFRVISVSANDFAGSRNDCGHVMLTIDR